MIPIFRASALLTGCLLILAAHAFAVSDPVLRQHNFLRFQRPIPANDLTLTDIHGQPIGVGELTGKVTILNFWRIDCPPCSMEKPILERVYRQYRNRGLEILAVNLSDDPTRIAEYMRNHQYTFTAAYAPDNEVALRSQKLSSGATTTFVVNSDSEAVYEVAGLPTTFLIDRQGNLVGKSTGLVNWESEPLARLLESLLGRDAPPRRIAAARTEDSAPGVPRESLRKKDRKDSNEEPAVPTQSPGPQPSRNPSPRYLEEAVFGTPAASSSLGQASMPEESSDDALHNPDMETSTEVTDRSDEESVRLAQQPPASPPPARRLTYPPRNTRSAPRTTRPVRTQRTQVAPSPTVGNSQPGDSAGLPPGIPYKRPSSATSPSYSSRPSVPSPAPRQTGRSTPSPQITPDDDGYVTARIPGTVAQTPTVTPQEPPAAQSRAASHTRPAIPVAPPNPIGGFILDSFDRRRPQPTRPTQVQPVTRGQSDRGEGSFFQRLGQGISNTFSTIIPGN